MSLQKAIERAFEKKRNGGWKQWERFFVLCDLHDVIIPGTYTRNNAGRRFYPGAEEVLRWFSDREDMCLILWTASHGDSIADIREWMGQSGIRFDYVNENPECPSNDLLDTSS